MEFVIYKETKMSAEVNQAGGMKSSFLMSDMLLLAFGIAAGVTVGLGAVALAPAGWQLVSGLIAPAVGQASATGAGSVVAQELQTMGLPLAEESKAFWYVARAGGILAFLLLWLSTIFGVLMSSKMLKGKVDASLLYGLHEFFPTLAVIFAAIHALVLMGDSYIKFSLVDLLVPFAASYEPVWTGLGSLALYLSLALIASFYLKNVISRKVWRAFHYTAFLAFVLALVHGMQAGTDTAVPGVWWMYVISGATLFFATLYRILTAQGEKRPAPATAGVKVSGRVRESQPAAVAAERHSTGGQVETQPVL